MSLFFGNVNNMMKIEPVIVTLPEKRLIGKRKVMSLADNQTYALWHTFMSKRNEIKNILSNELFSIQVFPPSFDFESFNMHTEFEKWAAVEVSNFDILPNEMETIILQNGLYAVFHFKGLNTDTKIFEYIYTTWIPASNYSLDSRPHFEIMGEKYKNADPESEEEIWIPIKPK